MILNPYISFPTASTVSITDSFNRADSATLGTADTGQVWDSSAGSSGVFGISTNKAYLSTTAANSVAVLDSGILDYSISATSTSTTTDWGFTLRYVDNNNYLRVFCTSQYWVYISTRISGTQSTIASLASTPLVDGTVFRVDIIGDDVNVYMDDVLKLTGDLSGVLTSGTKAGLLSGNTSINRWEDFSLTQL